MPPSDERATPRLPEIVAGIYDLLEGLDAPGRARAIRSVLAMFDDPPPSAEREPAASQLSPTWDGVVALSQVQAPPQQGGSRFVTGKRAQSWLRKHGITDALLERVFDMETGDAELIATVPGSGRRELTTNCYLIVGVQAFLRRDEPRFSEAEAVALCKRESCYDVANHAHTRAQFGSRISGTKESSYVLPAPGLDAAASLIKAMAQES